MHAHATVYGVFVVIVETIIQCGRSIVAPGLSNGRHSASTSDLLLRMEGLVGTVMLHLELMAALVGMGQHVGTHVVVIVMQILLIDLHGTIYTARHHHVLRLRVHVHDII